MTLAPLTMSRRELNRVEWMIQVRERRVTQAQVAERPGIGVRQVERLYRAYKSGGAAALISKKRGRPSPRRLPETTRTEVLRTVRERYVDFGPTLAHEKLTESHGVKISVETLRGLTGLYAQARGILAVRPSARVSGSVRHASNLREHYL
jgi:transposase